MAGSKSSATPPLSPSSIAKRSASSLEVTSSGRPCSASSLAALYSSRETCSLSNLSSSVFTIKDAFIRKQFSPKVKFFLTRRSPTVAGDGPRPVSTGGGEDVCHKSTQAGRHVEAARVPSPIHGVKNGISEATAGDESRPVSTWGILRLSDRKRGDKGMAFCASTRNEEVPIGRHFG